MRAVDVISAKRDGLELTSEQIDYFIRDYVNGQIPDYQAAALAMAILFRGMTPRETADLTRAMAQSGVVLDLSDVARIVVDKHSSGGVGDKTTLIVAPIVAANGVTVGKMSGRGLSFSGGTLDKLEAISGVRTDLSVDDFKAQLRRIGLAVVGQTHELAPADALLYALRDVTGTVPAMPLIASSIMSKKIAAGANAIVLDVKVGKGAFMKTEAEAEELAQLMVDIGQQLGRRMAAIIGDMDQPLGLAIGNALEVAEAIEVLKGAGPTDLAEHSNAVAAEMLLLAGAATTIEEARAMARRSLDDGSALAKFRELIAAQGGDPAIVDDPGRLPAAPLIETLRADRSGFIALMDAAEFGYAVVDLGGGRAKKGDAVDPAVGIMLSDVAKIGNFVEAGTPLLQIHASDSDSLARAKRRLAAAISISDRPEAPRPVVHRVIR